MLQDEIMKLQTYKMFEGEDTVYVERDDVLEVLKQQPCEDAVSREAVEDIVMWYDGQREMLDEIQKLPSVQPKQKTGHWNNHQIACMLADLFGADCILDKIRGEIEETYMNLTYEEIHKVGGSWGLRKALEIIDKYKEVDREYKESKWVKVEDELPELYREVWLSCRDYEVWLSCRGYKKVVRGYLSPDYHKSWYVYDSECGYYNINNANAWMYVERPKPYKAEKR